MDSCKSVRTLAVIAMLMLAYTGGASASFKKCYLSCDEDCRAAVREVTYCITKCLIKCIGKNVLDVQDDSCDYHCAINQCQQLGDDVDKMEDCVHKCGGCA